MYIYTAILNQGCIFLMIYCLFLFNGCNIDLINDSLINECNTDLLFLFIEKIFLDLSCSFIFL